MSTVQLKNYKCHYEFQDHGKAETLIFSNSLGTNYSMWNAVVAIVSQQYNILLHDTRGHGLSSCTQEELSIAELGDDVIELLDYLKLDHVIFCGLSMGGLIGQYVGIHHPTRFSKIILANTASKIGSQESWNDRISHVSANGLSSILVGTADRWFTEGFRESNTAEVEDILEKFVANDLKGYCANCAAVRDGDFRDDINKITAPTLVISGTEDLVTTVVDGNFMTSEIPNAKHVTLKAAHLSAVELPQLFAAHILSF